MAKKSPLARVKEEHGSKAELAKKVIGILERPEDEEDAVDFDHRVETMSNRKLLRLWDAQQVLDSKFGSKNELAKAIAKAHFPGGNADYEKKISGFTLPKLLDLARRHKLLRNNEMPTL
ncbi:MAG: hypothetical protein ACNA8W_11675 [Bradymonadaceae bacterium]